MRASGGRIFWASFLLTLAVIGPLLGLFAFWGVQQNRQAVQTQQAQSGVPIQRPGSLSLLLAVAAGLSYIKYKIKTLLKNAAEKKG